MTAKKFHYLTPKTYALFGFTLGIISLCLLALGYYYGDIRQVQGTTTVLVLSTLQCLLAQHLSRSANEILVHIINLCAITIVKLTFPEGTSGAPLFIVCGLSTVTFSSRNTVAYTFMVIGGLLVLSLDYLGPIGGEVPPKINMAVSLSLFGLYTFLFVGDANRKKRRASKRLQETEKALLERQNEMQRQRSELLRANAKLQHQATLLDAQLERATRITKTLASRRIDEDELVRAMHHDLREPLRSMISFNQLVTRKILKHSKNLELRTFLEFALDAGVRMDRMLADLLTFSTTSTSDALALTSLETVVEKAKMNLSALIKSSSAHISVSKLPEVMGVETQLIQLFQNLLANSIKYSQPDVPPIITITRQKLQNGNIKIEVTDNGLGIAELEQKRIFNLFSQVKNGEENQSGSGVGLALCRRITISHNATLTVHSEIGRGSCFSVVFPNPNSVINERDLHPAPALLVIAKQQDPKS